MLTALINASKAAVGDWIALWQRVKPLWPAGYAAILRRIPTVSDTLGATLYSSYGHREEGAGEVTEEPNWLLLPGAAEGDPPIGMCVDGEYIYWTQEEGAGSYVGRARLDGTEIVQLVKLPGRFALQITAFGEHIYWLTTVGAKYFLSRAKRDGTEAEAEWVELPHPSEAIACDGTHIYWATLVGASNYIARATIAGTEIESTWVGPLTQIPVNLQLGGLGLIWTRGEERYLGSCTLAGGELNETWIETFPARSESLAVVGSEVYFASRLDLHVGRTQAIAGEAEERTWRALAANEEGGAVPWQIAADSLYVYWAAIGEGGKGHIGRTLILTGEAFTPTQIERVNTDGSDYDARWLEAAPEQVWAVAADGGLIYWIGGNPDSLHRITSAHEAPEAVYEGTEFGHGPNALVVAGGIYFADRLGRIMFASGWGEEPVQLVSMAEGPHPTEQVLSITVVGEHLYWITDGNRIGRSNPDGSEPDYEWQLLTEVAASLTKGLTSDGTWLYFSGVGENQRWLGRVLLSGESLEEEWQAVEGEGEGPLTTDGTYLYWAHLGFIGRVRYDGAGALPKWRTKPEAGTLGSAGLASVALGSPGGSWELRIEKRLGAQDLLASALLSFDESEWHLLGFDIDEAGVLRVYFDEVLIVEATNDQLAGGYVGIAGASADSIALHQLKMNGELLDALEAEENPLSEGGNWAVLPWAVDTGHVS